MQGDKVSNETKEGAVERFMKGLTRKNKVKRYQAYEDELPTHLPHPSTRVGVVFRDARARIMRLLRLFM